MGCFDSVSIMCPDCKTFNLIQTKSGPCDSKVYGQDEIPYNVAYGVVDETFLCENCGVLCNIKQRRYHDVSVFAEVIF